MDEDKKEFNYDFPFGENNLPKEEETKEQTNIPVNHKDEDLLDYDATRKMMGMSSYNERLKVLLEMYKDVPRKTIEQWALYELRIKDIEDGYFEKRYIKVNQAKKSVGVDEKRELRATTKKIEKSNFDKVLKASFVSIAGIAVAIGIFTNVVTDNRVKNYTDDSLIRVSHGGDVVDPYTKNYENMQQFVYDEDLAKRLLNIAAINPNLLDLEIASCYKELDIYGSKEVNDGDLKLMDGTIAKMKIISSDIESHPKEENYTAGVENVVINEKNGYENVIQVGNRLKNIDTFLDYVLSTGVIGTVDPRYEDIIKAVEEYKTTGTVTEESRIVIQNLMVDYEKFVEKQYEYANSKSQVDEMVYGDSTPGVGR